MILQPARFPRFCHHRLRLAIDYTPGHGGVAVLPGGRGEGEVLAVGADVGGDGDGGLPADPRRVRRGVEDLGASVAGGEGRRAQRADEPGAAAGGGAGQALVAVVAGPVFGLEAVGRPVCDAGGVEVCGDGRGAAVGGRLDERAGPRPAKNSPCATAGPLHLQANGTRGQSPSAHPTNQADRSWQVLSDALRLAGIGRVIRR